MTVLVFRVRFGLLLASIRADSSDGFCQDLQELRWDLWALLARRVRQKRQKLQDTYTRVRLLLPRTNDSRRIGMFSRRRL